MAPASPAGGVACPAKGLMRRDGRFVGRLLRVRESFLEQNTGASSLHCGRGLPCHFRRGCEPVGDWTAASGAASYRWGGAWLPVCRRVSVAPCAGWPRPGPLCAAGCTGGSHNASYAARAVFVFWDGPVLVPVLVLVARTGVRTCRCALGQRRSPARCSWAGGRCRRC
jgi:hypothetical protein